MFRPVLLSCLVLVLIAACADESPEVQKPVVDCSTPATVRDLTGFDGCGFVFELEDGTRLEPIRPVFFCGTPPLPREVTEDPLYNFEFMDGKEVLINYEVTDSPSICMIGDVIKVTCIKEVISTPELSDL